MINLVFTKFASDLFSNPIVLGLIVVVIAVAAVALLYFGGGTILKNITFGIEKRKCKQILEDPETLAFLNNVAKAQNPKASEIAVKILKDSKGIDWNKINEENDLVRVREMCENIGILRDINLTV